MSKAEQERLLEKVSPEELQEFEAEQRAQRSAFYAAQQDPSNEAQDFGSTTQRTAEGIPQGVQIHDAEPKDFGQVDDPTELLQDIAEMLRDLPNRIMQELRGD
jgi:hypothetical protein